MQLDHVPSCDVLLGSVADDQGPLKLDVLIIVANDYTEYVHRITHCPTWPHSRHQEGALRCCMLTMNFILPVPEASVPAVEICSERSVAGITGCRQSTQQ